MSNINKEDVKNNLLIATGLLGAVELSKSLTESKTLMAMVVSGIVGFSIFVAFLVHMAN